MPRPNALSLVALATLGLATGCEKQSPLVTLVSDGVVVKASATKYCRPNNKCNESTEKPAITIKPGGLLGIDVPRSVAEHGWRLGDQGPFRYDHYYAVPLPGPEQLRPGTTTELLIQRDPKHGVGEWTFTIKVK